MKCPYPGCDGNIEGFAIDNLCLNGSFVESGHYVPYTEICRGTIILLCSKDNSTHYKKNLTGRIRIPDCMKLRIGQGDHISLLKGKPRKERLQRAPKDLIKKILNNII